MFKKRLKGLLAMVLAGSIAMTALPLSASATIDGNISIADAGGGTVYQYDIGETAFESGDLKSSQLLTADNLWAIYSEVDGNKSIECVAGNELFTKLKAMKDNPSPTYSNVEIKSEHRILVTTDNPNTNVISTISADTVSDFSEPIDISSYNTALQDVVSWTAWYGVESDGRVDSGNLTQSAPNSVSANDTSISVSAETVKGLYNNESLNADGRFHSGITIIQLNIEYNTFNLPVKNVLGDQEKDAGGNDIKISVTQGESDRLDGDFFLCYIDSTNGTVKISDNVISTKTDLWTNIGSFAGVITGFNPSNLSLRRSVTMNVTSKSQYEGEFTTKDLFKYKHVNNNTTDNAALKYLYVEAPDKSIWKASYSRNWYFADKEHIDDAIRACLNYDHKANLIYFTEKTTIDVTGTTPTEGGTISTDKIRNPQILKDSVSPKTISELLAELAASIDPDSGKKYDLNGWELWSASLGHSGVLVDFHKIEFNTSGVTGVSAEMFNKAGFNKHPVIYFPQVDNTPSNPGGSSGGSSSRPEPSYDPDKPTIDGEEKDWDDVAREIGKFSEGETKTIYLGNDKTIPADVIKAIKDSKAIITFRISTAFNWTVDGSKLTDGDIHDYDFSIEVITATGVEILRGDVGVGFKIGDISDGATLNINFKIEHAQKFANLYKMVDGELVFVDNVKIDENGAAIGLEVTEAGDYVVMLGKMSDRPGDMDNDGIMNAKDSLAILKDFLGMESGANPLVSDMNGDSFINAKDALIIVKKSVGIE